MTLFALISIQDQGFPGQPTWLGSMPMYLVRFGSIYVNFDRVAMIRDLTPDPGDGPKLIRLEFSEGHSIDVTAHASQLLDWVDQRATNPANPPTVP